MLAVGGKRKRIRSAMSAVIPKRLLKDEQKKAHKAEKEEKRKRAFLVRDWFLHRKKYSDFHRLSKEIALSEREYYFRFIRMSPVRFEQLLSLLGPMILQDTTHAEEFMLGTREGMHVPERLCIEQTSQTDKLSVGKQEQMSPADKLTRDRMSAAERLTITLRCLATGESQESLCFSLGISQMVISDILSDTCMKLWDVLSTEYVQAPKTDDDWMQISDHFYVLSGMIHCLGAIDGKQIAIELPANSGTMYYNYYRKFFNLIMLAVCDPHYCFTLVDIGSHGNSNDDVLEKSQLGLRFESGKMNIPQPEQVEGCSADKLPYFLIGNERFPIKKWLMKPYPGSISACQKIFNCRLSRAQRCIENSFGILAARWRIFRQPIKATVENAQRYSLATIALHNYLITTETTSYCPRGFVDSEDSDGTIREGVWRCIIADDEDEGGLRRIPNDRFQLELQPHGVSLRESLTDYYLKEEEVNYQQEQVRAHRQILHTNFNGLPSCNMGQPSPSFSIE